MNRKSAAAAIEARLAHRRLLWLGKRGEDARPLLQFEQFAGAYSLIAPLDSTRVDVLAVESLTGLREDGYDIDVSSGDASTERAMAEQRLLASLHQACNAPAALITYRPYGMLWSDDAGDILSSYLGSTFQDYAPLEVKPFVEQSFRKHARMGCLPWTYIPGSPRRTAQLENALADGPIVLRANTSSGGEGFELVRGAAELENSKLLAEEDEVAYGPYLAGNVPLNVSGCVFPDGGVTLHTPSVQLIGIPQCTLHSFGYCGNDFGAAKDLELEYLDGLERMALDAGRWLGGRGYIGAFGLDAMVYEGRVLFVEINPRFQGSSRMSAMLDEQAGRPDVYFDHLMAWLGIESYETLPLKELVQEQSSVAQVICANKQSAPVQSPARPRVPAHVTPCVVPGPGVAVESNSLVFSLEFDRRVTAGGQALYPEAASIVEEALSEVRPAAR